MNRFSISKLPGELPLCCADNLTYWGCVASRHVQWRCIAKETKGGDQEGWGRGCNMAAVIHAVAACTASDEKGQGTSMGHR